MAEPLFPDIITTDIPNTDITFIEVTRSYPGLPAPVVESIRYTVMDEPGDLPPATHDELVRRALGESPAGHPSALQVVLNEETTRQEYETAFEEMPPPTQVRALPWLRGAMNDVHVATARILGLGGASMVHDEIVYGDAAPADQYRGEPAEPVECPTIIDLDISSLGASRESIERLSRTTQAWKDRELAEVDTALAGMEATRKAVSQQYNRKNRKLSPLMRRQNALNAELSALVVRLQTVQNEVSSLYRTKDRAERESRVLVKRKGRAESVRPTPPPEVDGAASYLADVGGKVVPGTLKVDVAVGKVSWTTEDVFIRDGFGGYLPRNFGKFHVKVELTSGEYTTGVDVSVEPATGVTNQTQHPHIYGSRPCLGNVEGILLASLQAGDYVAVVVMSMEFLEEYNFRNPYHSLENYGDLNRWVVPTCSSMLHIMTDCYCDRCALCGRPDVAGEGVGFLQDCGACSTCCATLHGCVDGELRTTGIPGSYCFLKE